jgi:hypothetical protein
MGMSVKDMNGMTQWEYTAVIEEHNSRSEEADTQLEPWTKEEYEAEKQRLMDRGDPTIQVH